MHLAGPSRSEFVPPVPACDEHRGHAVQFYADDEFLIAKLERFVGTSVGHGDAVVIIATAVHRDRLAQRLVARGIDVAGAVDQGRYVSLDAADTLSLYMRDERPETVPRDYRRYYRSSSPQRKRPGIASGRLWRDGGVAMVGGSTPGRPRTRGIVE
jgi:hypothetical protein